MRGQVWKVIAGFYEIAANGTIYIVRGRGKLRQQNLTPLVGDFVEFTPHAFLEQIYPRQNWLTRPKVANIDQAIIVTSIAKPIFASLLLNKFLAIIEFNNIKPVLVFTKTDLSALKPWIEYRAQGYETFAISNKDQTGFAKLSTIFANQLSVFTGQTGVGKSSTINAIAGTNFKTQAISKSLGRGKHTTRVVQIITYRDGLLIDTPGFSALEFTLLPRQLAKSYHDFQRYAQTCKFRSCLHQSEQICAVKNAVKQGQISAQRYRDYLTLLQEAKLNANN